MQRRRMLLAGLSLFATACISAPTVEIAHEELSIRVAGFVAAEGIT